MVYTLQSLTYHRHITGCGSSIGSMSTWHTSGPEFDPQVRHVLSWRLGHENISTVILPLLLIQEAVFSYWRKNVRKVLVNCLGGLPRNSVVR